MAYYQDTPLIGKSLRESVRRFAYIMASYQSYKPQNVDIYDRLAKKKHKCLKGTIGVEKVSCAWGIRTSRSTPAR